MGLCGRIKAASRTKITERSTKRTFEQSLALADRLRRRNIIDSMLKRAEKMEAEIIRLNARIARTKDGTIKRKELLDQIMRKNSKRSSLLLEANKLHEEFAKLIPKKE